MRVRWTKLASRDLATAITRISNSNPAAAAKVAARIRAAADLLGTHPEIGRPGTVAGTREKLCLPYPYLIVYEIHGAEEVWVLRLYHMAQDWP